MRAASYNGPLQKMYADQGDAWKCLVACILLNLTSRAQVDKVIDELFVRWPTPYAMATSSKPELMAHLAPLGLADRRSESLRKMSMSYVVRSERPIPEHVVATFSGVGPYALDSYRFFVLGDTSRFESGDKVLAAYLEGIDDGP